MAELSYAQVSALLKYDSETGKLFWIHRPVSMFTDSLKQWTAEMNAERWNVRCAGKEAFTAASEGYRVGTILKRRAYAHRIAWLLHYGVWPTNHIDHINGDRSDNRIVNLRDATPLENRRNSRRRSDNKSGICGVSWCPRSNKWETCIRVKGRSIHLGKFASLSEAAAARAEASAKYGFSTRHGAPSPS
jgi:hypothetical protein